MLLKDWINSVGILKVASLVKAHESSIRHWRNGRRLPKSRQMHKIRKLSAGAVSYEDMIDTFYSKKQ